MKIFVIGATGWIGSAVVDQLLRSGYAVTGLALGDGVMASEFDRP